MTFQFKVLVKRDWGRTWHLDNVIEVTAPTQSEALKIARGFYPRKKGSMPRAIKPVSDPSLFALRGCHGKIFSSICPKQNASGRRRRSPEVTA